MSEPLAVFDDFLGLERTDLSRFALVVFAGRSGSGKSTALRHLREGGSMQEREASWVCGGPIDWSRVEMDQLAPVVCVDEISRLRDLFALVLLLQRGRQVLCASHLPMALTRLLSLRWRTRHYRTDRDPEKIARYLRRRGVAAAPGTVRSFVDRLGATYTDVDVVLERAPGRSFDLAWRRFRALDRVERTGCRGRWWRW